MLQSPPKRISMGSARIERLALRWAVASGEGTPSFGRWAIEGGLPWPVRPPFVRSGVLCRQGCQRGAALPSKPVVRLLIEPPTCRQHVDGDRAADQVSRGKVGLELPGQIAKRSLCPAWRVAGAYAHFLHGPSQNRGKVVIGMGQPAILTRWAPSLTASPAVADASCGARR
jgi:hypothetical protein